MKSFGLIGFPLSHSFSEQYFTEKFRQEGISACTYSLFPLAGIELLPRLINDNKSLRGLNVTIPYKEQVIPFLNNMDDIAMETGAVNTIKIYRGGESVYLKGFNTDVFGFEVSLRLLLKHNHTHALILGSGGASKAVSFVLQKLGISMLLVSRTPKKPGHISYEMVTPELIAQYKVIVNTSPAGMFPDTEKCPDIPYEFLTPEHVLFDLIYNPPETRFMALGRAKGAVVSNGMKMLRLQADKSWEIWNDDTM